MACINLSGCWCCSGVEDIFWHAFGPLVPTQHHLNTTPEYCSWPSPSLYKHSEPICWCVMQQGMRIYADAVRMRHDFWPGSSHHDAHVFNKNILFKLPTDMNHLHCELYLWRLWIERNRHKNRDLIHIFHWTLHHKWEAFESMLPTTGFYETCSFLANQNELILHLS